MSKFYKCGDQVVALPDDANVSVVCGGEEAELLVPNTSDGAGEKHVPVVEKDGNKVTVKVGEVAHPMLPAHYIQLILIDTEKGKQLRNLTSDNAPEAVFYLDEGDDVKNVYEYCNLHGLWQA